MEVGVATDTQISTDNLETEGNDNSQLSSDSFEAVVTIESTEVFNYTHENGEVVSATVKDLGSCALLGNLPEAQRAILARQFMIEQRRILEEETDENIDENETQEEEPDDGEPEEKERKAEPSEKSHAEAAGQEKKDKANKQEAQEQNAPEPLAESVEENTEPLKTKAEDKNRVIADTGYKEATPEPATSIPEASAGNPILETAKESDESSGYSPPRENSESPAVKQKVESSPVKVVDAREPAVENENAHVQDQAEVSDVAELSESLFIENDMHSPAKEFEAVATEVQEDLAAIDAELTIEEEMPVEIDNVLYEGKVENPRIEQIESDELSEIAQPWIEGELLAIGSHEVKDAAERRATEKDIFATEDSLVIAELGTPMKEVEDTILEIAGFIETSENMEETAEVHEILDEINLKVQELNTSPAASEKEGEGVIVEDDVDPETIEEELEELFSRLFERIGIEYAPELLNSLVKLAMRQNIQELFMDLEPKVETGTTQGTGTHELLNYLVAALGSIKKSAQNAYRLGKSAMQLYSMQLYKE